MKRWKSNNNGRIYGQVTQRRYAPCRCAGMIIAMYRTHIHMIFRGCQIWWTTASRISQRHAHLTELPLRQTGPSVSPTYRVP
jgi:hypothetical protein